MRYGFYLSVFMIACFYRGPFAGEILGDITSNYGEYGGQACVHQVAKAFGRVAGNRSKRRDFRFLQETPSLNWFSPIRLTIADHIQSVARLPGMGNDNWVALTHNSQAPGETGLYLVRFDWIISSGFPWDLEQVLMSKTRSYYYHRFPRFNHAGGMQALGTQLFIAMECNNKVKCNSEIYVLDVKRPQRPREISRLLLDGSYGELGPDINSRASAVAATRLADKRTLLFIRGVGGGKSGWFFVSKSADLGRGWEFLGLWEKSRLALKTPWHAWENVNFITECESGDVFLVGLGTMRDWVNLYKVTGDLSKKESPNFEFVAAKNLRTSGLLTSPRNGGGVHVSPAGELAFYITDRHPPLKIEEFY